MTRAPLDVSRKVTAATAGGALGVFLSDLAVQVWAWWPPSGEYALVSLCVLAAGYLIPEKAP